MMINQKALPFLVTRHSAGGERSRTTRGERSRTTRGERSRTTLATPKGRERGIAMGVALTIVLMITLFTAMIVPHALSHLNLAFMDKRFADALDLAEAGINYEIQKMNDSASYPPPFDPQNSPGSVTFSDNRSFSAYGTQTLDSNGNPIYQQFTVYSTGVSQGVPRSVRVIVYGANPFNSGPTDDSGAGTGGGGWALFGVNELTVTQGMTVQDGHPVGGSGTINVPGINFHVPLYLVGPNASLISTIQTNVSPDPVRSLPLKEPYPTVDVLANRLAGALSGVAKSGTQGMAWLRDSNSVAKATITNGSGTPLDSALADSTNNYVLSNNLSSNIVIRNPYTDGRTAHLYIKGINPPSGGGSWLTINEDNGPVALWIDKTLDTNGQEVSTPPPVNFKTNKITNTQNNNALLLQVYHNGSQTLAFDRSGGGSVFWGSFYAIGLSTTGTPIGTATITGNGNFKGYMIGTIVRATSGGAPNVTSPWTVTLPGLFGTPTLGYRAFDWAEVIL